MGSMSGSVNKPGRTMRSRLIGAIHAVAAKNGIDDETRRALQQDSTGKASCSDMTEHELRRVLERITGNREIPARSKRPTVPEDKKKLVNKVYALLGDRPISYAEGILKHMFGNQAPEVMEWAKPDQLWRLVSALEYDKKRKGKKL